MSRSPVTLRIEKLVFDGFTLNPVEVEQLRNSIEGELTRLLSRDDAGEILQDALTPAISASAIQMPSPLHPRELGRGVARSVHGSLTRKPERRR